MSQEFGELKRLNIRTVWANEAKDFTPWLSENILELGRSIGMELEFLESEAPVGGFSADLIAKDISSDSFVVIENQFSKTNHDHLGKLITYGAGYDAYAVIWVAEEIREEHREALDWLNERTDTDTLFFAIEVEVLQIGDSLPAYNFKCVVLPNEWQKVQHRESKARTSPKGLAYQAFYQVIFDELRQKKLFASKQTPRPQNWQAFGSGFPGIRYAITFRQGGRACVELWIDGEERFESIRSHQSEITTNLGSELIWEQGDRSGLIASRRPGVIDNPSEELGIIQEWMIHTLIAFKKTFDPIFTSEFR